MTDLSHLINDIERLPGTRILCIGDVMLDHYVYGQVDRVSPEAPVPVLRVERETRTLGGAGNVVRNLHSLGAHACLVSVLGNDSAGREINQLVAGARDVESHLLVEAGRQTTVKTRYVAATQQM
ncbi:MAG: bifunctional heptose 7-phosphate kinase/heptose 1-phosphate adenyltransferase, partial [Alphaproteobacteria bacterium]|nr:bifunctional heptose 7-phosphate kinase/heptose 1-phosphate adenyltransferase [Alphaproteobacteria bacterium]